MRCKAIILISTRMVLENSGSSAQKETCATTIYVPELDPIVFEVPSDMKKTIAVHKKHCKAMYDEYFQNDDTINKFLALGRKLYYPLLQYLYDMYQHERVFNMQRQGAVTYSTTAWMRTNLFCDKLCNMKGVGLSQDDSG